MKVLNWFITALILAALPAAHAQRMYDSNGRKIGRVDGERYYSASGHQIGRVDRNYIYDGSSRQLHISAEVTV